MSDNISLKDIACMLKSLNERLTNIEHTISHDSKEGRCLSRPRPTRTRQSQSQDIVQDGDSDNALNKTLEELHRLELSPEKQSRSTTSCKPKSASFRENAKRRHYTYNKRHSLSIPPDREEHKRRSQFRRECLARAIQWNFVDVVKSLNGKSGYSIRYRLPSWLSGKHIRTIREGQNEKSRIRQFLLILAEQEYESMREWLGQGFLEERVVEMIWKTYEEFSDKHTNTIKVKCFLCRLIILVPADYVIDYLYSADIVSKVTLVKTDKSCLPPEADHSIWKIIISECKGYCCPKTVVDAFEIALDDASRKDDFDEDEIKGLLADIARYQRDSELLFNCQCSVLCTQSLHPVSVMESMSLVQAYMTPQRLKVEQVGTSSRFKPNQDMLQSQRYKSDHVEVPIPSQSLKLTNEKTDLSSTDTPSPSSSIEYIEKSSDWESRLSDQEQTYLKSATFGNHTTDDRRSVDTTEPQMSQASESGDTGTNEAVEIDTKVLPAGLQSKERQKRRLSMKSIRRRQDRTVTRASSSDSSELEHTKLVDKQRGSSAMACPRYGKVTHQRSTQAVQNNPQIIYGKNVYISHI